MVRFLQYGGLNVNYVMHNMGVYITCGVMPVCALIKVRVLYINRFQQVDHGDFFLGGPQYVELYTVWYD